MASLAAKALHIHHRQPKNLNVGQRGFDGFKTAGLDDGYYEFHGFIIPPGVKTLKRRRLNTSDISYQLQFKPASHRMLPLRENMLFFQKNGCAALQL
jgi:hypothetical protein